MKCTRCRKWIGVFAILRDDGEYEPVCANCLTDQERHAIDAGAALQKQYEQTVERES